MGFAGFIYARNILLSKWQEASVLKLQRAAHQVDMRLATVKNWIQVFNQTTVGQDTAAIHELTIEQLKKQQGVDQVHLSWIDNQTPRRAPTDTRMSSMMRQMADGRPMMMRRFHNARIQDITPPRYDNTINHETGGDLYDFLEADDGNADRIGIAVGDVSGHGIPAALLMASVRAFLKSRVSQPGSAAEIMSGGDYPPKRSHLRR